MLALCLMLSKAYYAQNYAGIIGLGLRGHLYSLKNFLGTLENHAQKFSPVNLSPFTVLNNDVIYSHTSPSISHLYVNHINQLAI